MTATAFVELKQKLTKLSENERRQMSAFLIRLRQETPLGKKQPRGACRKWPPAKKSAYPPCANSSAMPSSRYGETGALFSAMPSCSAAATRSAVNFALASNSLKTRSPSISPSSVSLV